MNPFHWFQSWNGGLLSVGLFLALVVSFLVFNVVNHFWWRAVKKERGRKIYFRISGTALMYYLATGSLSTSLIVVAMSTHDLVQLNIGLIILLISAPIVNRHQLRNICD